MADYYPLIARAVAALEKNSGENRRALYERARAALLTQLRGVTPALDESDITRERLALEESIRKVEAESARKFVETSRAPSPAPKVRPAEPQPAERPVEPRPVEPRPVERAAEPRRPRDLDEQPPPPRRYVSPPASPQEMRVDTPRRPLPPAAKPAPPSRPVAPPQAPPKPTPRPSAPVAKEPPPAENGAAMRNLLRRSAPEWRPSPDDGAREARNLDAVDAPFPPRVARDGNAAPPLREEERRREPAAFNRFEPRMHEPPAAREPPGEPEHAPYGGHEFSEPMLESSFPMDDAHRGSHVPVLEEEDRPRPRPRMTWRPSRGMIVGLAIAAMALAGIYVLVCQGPPNLLALYRSMRAPAVEPARETPPPSNARTKITDRIEPNSQSSSAPEPGSQAGAAVAQKVVLYEEDPADPNGKRFVGSAIWRTETVTPGPGQPADLAVRAEVEVPERRLTMTWSFRRNTDKSLPASHTVEIVFKFPPDFPAGGISNVPGILMKQAEQTRGVPLAGLAVKVTNGVFLIGLSSAEPEKERNLQLLKDRPWFDIPVVYNNNRRAILAIEKGNPGERVFAEAFKVWKQ
jgi:hypothetical protein